MRHLSRTELVDLAEGLLAAERAAHVDECARCRAESHALRRVATNVRAVEMPEPSPLFWQHLSAQIRGAVDREPQPNRVDDGAGWWGTVGRRFLPLAMALVAVMAAGLWWLAASRSSVPASTVPRLVERESLSAPERIEPISPDVAWELVWSLADQQGALDVEGLDVEIAPGAAERAVLGLTPDEQRELVRLLDEAIAHGPEPTTGT
ncbi:MAG: hypothetical protein GEV06_06170 [Luteitalea sp.]|nr:hypothetical protein [Luteitalea sp.]